MQKLFLDPVKRTFLTGIINDVNMNKTMGISDFPVITSAKTQKYLHKLGFKWPKQDIPYLVRILKYMEFVGFIGIENKIIQ